MAAVLACTPGSVLSHRGAGALHGLLRYSGTRIDVTATGGRPRADIFVHRGSRLENDERQFVEGIPVTSVARTLIDLASVVRLDLLDRAIAEADRRDVFDLRALQRLMTPGRRGVTPLREALLKYHDPGFTRSQFERRFAYLCRDGGLPPPAMNAWACGQEVDAVWEVRKVAVQLDSFEFHRTRSAFEDDRARDAVLQLAGYRTLHVTDRWLANDPQEVLRVLRPLLALRT